MSDLHHTTISAGEIWSQSAVKLIAILRGITPEEIAPAVEVLLAAGFRAIEIPLNSPSPFDSIKIAAEVASSHKDASSHKERCLIGAGTVLDAGDVAKVHEAGGNLIVSPNVDPAVITATTARGMLSAPGVFTATECLLALKSGAAILKIFPASVMGANGIKALRAILPAACEICPVGGVGNADFAAYLGAGATGFGLGTSLYRQGMSTDALAKNAGEAVDAYLAAYEAEGRS